MENPTDRFVTLQWFTWQTRHRGEAEDPQVAFEAGWHLGAWHALKSNSDLGLGFAIQNLRRDVRQLTDTIDRLERIAGGYHSAEIDSEIEAQSYYWPSDVQP